VRFARNGFYNIGINAPINIHSSRFAANIEKLQPIRLEWVISDSLLLVNTSDRAKSESLPPFWGGKFFLFW
ncbi:hypothetical protein DW394_24985, partial [Salmonella enterica]|nr:hypothetical protein [Salmonella enterica]